MDITIPSRFCGPPDSGNGGYVCGRVAALVGGPAEVTLRRPPPLDTPMTVVRDADGVRLQHDGALVAEGRPDPVVLDLPAPPSWDEAQRASGDYLGHRDHAYPSCFVCSPERDDGLRIFCGPWRDGVVAGTWIPGGDLADPDGRVKPEFLWSAVDCPGSWSVIGRTEAGVRVPPPPGPMLLGRLAAKCVGEVRAGEPCVVVGWPLGADGRKYHVGAAVFTRTGDPVCFSRGTWIALKPASP